MCQVYNSVGCLTVLKSHLRRHSVNDFHSVYELIGFQKNYPVAHHGIIARHSRLIDDEKNTLKEEITQLNVSIETKRNKVEEQLKQELERLKHRLDNLPSKHATIFQSIVGYFRKSWIKKRIRYDKQYIAAKIWLSLFKFTYSLRKKNKRHQYLLSDFDAAVNKSSSSELKGLKRKKEIIDEINTFIYGALGEEKVVKELEKLPDNYILINDFNCTFRPPIYNRREGDAIKSVQIDHVLVGPEGVFLIETKNWSVDSLNNLDLRSPVAQIRRTSYALFKMLSDGVANSDIALRSHHWGDRKIPVRNIIVFINQKPSKEFQYVKVLSLNQLCQYIGCFDPIFSKEETQVIANYLLGLSA